MDKIVRNKMAFTVVEILIASSVFSIFLIGALTLFSQGQNTIIKSSWINNATKEAAIASRTMSELSKSSSFPSTVRNNLIKTGDKLPAYKAKILKKGESISIGAVITVILSFPICTEQTETTSGTIKWVSLRLIPGKSSRYANLELQISEKINYNPNPPSYTENMNTGIFTESLVFDKKIVLLSDIEKITINTPSPDAIEINTIQSCPNIKNTKKESKLFFTLNVEII